MYKKGGCDIRHSMHTKREQHTLTVPAAVFDESFILAEGTLKASAPKRSVQPEVPGDIQHRANTFCRPIIQSYT